MMKGINGLIFAIFVVGLWIQICCGQNISRGSFPEGFVFGTASSAYQYEGKVVDFSNADVANDQYHLYSEDIKLMKDMGMDAYRFSIAWSRIYPNGTGQINQAGIDHYNNLINTLLANGIEPYVTIYHWDLPQSLQDRYLGWLNPQIIKNFAIYAETCFKEFGDRVKFWITFNEPLNIAVQGYDVGLQAPGRCSVLLGVLCQGGNSATEPYIVGHNILLSHATVVDTYKKKYQPEQRGSIGISLNSYWYEPATNSPDDIQATQRALDFNLGWFIEPLILGDYPSSMRTRVASRLPSFSKIESTLLKGSFDFIGINHYTTWYASNNNINIVGVLLNDSLADSGASTLRMDDGNNPLQSIKDALKDQKRIKYHNDYLTNLLAAIKDDGCNVKGYFVWSLLDNWEWQAGFSSRFGLYYVDYNDKLKRYAKDSVKWFKNFLAS
ncbi:hypothetical protein RD792_011596 [Penstemon davidsonii]|uniref:Beta-glucosidase n=1 Tax=Penstemon davidsonii TaxID=160366 RepID=A0ABR0DWB6_9LAMI|nr:hypothetical protein RD792_011596 [Penstemon davidsonii]